MNLCSFTIGNRKKKRPIMMNKTPIYFIGSLNRSPKIIIAAIVSTNALIPSHAALTSITWDDWSDLIKKNITPIYPIVPVEKLYIPPSFANFLYPKSPTISDIVNNIIS